MRAYFKKLTSAAVLSGYLLGSTGIARASEGAPKKIDIKNAEIVFSYDQPAIFKVGRMQLECGKTYLIDKNVVIEKPYVALDKLLNYLLDQKKYHPTEQGSEKVKSAVSTIVDLINKEAGELNPFTGKRRSGRQVSSAGLEIFKQAASNGMIMPDEYDKLANGDVYVSQLLGKKKVSDDLIEKKYGRLDEGVIVRVDHSKDNCPKPSIVARAKPVEEPAYAEGLEEKPVGGEPSMLEKTVEEFKPSEQATHDIQEQAKEQERKNWARRHPVATTFIALGAATLIGAIISNRKEEPADNRITGGDLF